jgi:hypothetical protein
VFIWCVGLEVTYASSLQLRLVAREVISDGFFGRGVPTVCPRVKNWAVMMWYLSAKDNAMNSFAFFSFFT